MSRLIKQHIKTIIALVIVLFFLISLVFFAYSADRYFKRGTKLHEKTTFTDQEKKILWSELGLEYIDLGISKAYYNYEHDLYVISEEFDSVDAEIKYLKQFNGNENVHKVGENETLGVELSANHDGHEVYEIFDIKYKYIYEYIRCFTYEENGKYYLEFHKCYAGRNEKDYNLYEMFGLND
jgi:hypothetical protein